MKFFIKALLDLLTELAFAIIALPILILCIIIYELGDPVFKFFDKMKQGPRPEKPVVQDTW